MSLFVDVSVEKDIPASHPAGGSPVVPVSPGGMPVLVLSSPESLVLGSTVGSTVVPGDSVVSTLSLLVVDMLVLPSIVDVVVPSPVPGVESSPQAPSTSEPPITASKALQDVVLPSCMRAS